jgi:hypothetical protein
MYTRNERYLRNETYMRKSLHVLFAHYMRKGAVAVVPARVRRLYDYQQERGGQATNASISV